MMLDELNAIELLQNIRSYLLTLNPDIDEHLTAPEREHKLSHSPVFLKEKIVATLMRIDDITPARKRKVHTLLTSMESMLKEHHTVPKEFTINEKEELLYKGSSNRRVRQTLKALYEFASHTEGRTKNGLFPDIRTLRRSSPEIALHTITRLIPTLSGLDSFRYLRSIHYDIAVPDFAKCRFFYRLGMIESPPGSRGGREEYLRGCVLVARANRVSVSMVDRLIGLFTGVEKIRLIEALCVKEPQCERCVVTPYCSYFKYVEKPFKKNAPIPASEIGEERPRERLVRYGSDALTDAELLAIILRTGSRDVSVLELAKTALKKFHSLRTLDTASVAEIAQVKGIGRAKAAGVKAALHWGKECSPNRCRVKRKSPAVPISLIRIEAHSLISCRKYFT